MNITFYLFIIFVALACYFIGLRQGNRDHIHDYDEGYNDGMNAAMELKEDFKFEKAKELVQELDELFEGPEDEDVEILDGGEY